MRASSNASKPHSYADSFSLVGRLGPRRLPITSNAAPIPVATIRNSRVGRYSASTLVVLFVTGRLGGHDRGVPPSRDAPSGEWCPRGDSNPHSRSRYHLKVVRLPIPPPGQSIRLKHPRSSAADGFYCSALTPVAE